MQLRTTRSPLALIFTLALGLAAACSESGEGSDDAGMAGGQVDGGGSADVAPRDGAGADAGALDGGTPDAAFDGAGGPGDAPVSTTEDAAPGDAADGGGRLFTLVVTESPPGPDNGNPMNWGGLLVYTAAGDGQTLTPIAGVPAAALADPAGLAFRAASSELLVGNRHGNNAADGVAGSISRFVYDAASGTFTPHGTITGNGLAGVHALAFNPVNGELFAANRDNGVSRFTFDAAGNATPNGKISDGATRGVLISPDGKRLYVTGASTTIRQFDLASGNELPSVAVTGGAMLHYLAWRAGELYVAGLSDGLIHRFTVAADDSLTSRDTIMASSPLAVVFSPDNLAMWSTGHRDSDVLERFAFEPASGGWTRTTMLATAHSLGAALVIP